MRAVILNASAGSGKTYTLAYNYVRDVIGEPMLYRHILAVTFTNKATEEMKSRILKEIHLLSDNRKSNYLGDLCRDLELDEESIRKRARRVQSLILHDYSHFTILTIDKFFQRILHAFLKELNIDLNFNLELEFAPILSRSVDSLIERIASSERLKEWVTAYSKERMSDNESWDPRKDIIKLGGELFKESYHTAMKNSAKMEELSKIYDEATKFSSTTRQEFQQIAKEALELISENSLSIDDFSSKKSSGAAYFYTIASGAIEEPKKRARDCSLSIDGWMVKSRTPQYRELLSRLQAMMRQLCDYYDSHIEYWNSTSLLKEHYRTYALLSDIYNETQLIWRKENTILLSETKNILSKFIEDNDTPFIYEKVGNRFDRYLIDEFQDTSEREWLNFLPLLHDAMSHLSQLSTDEEKERPAVLLVGDVKQSIYRWRGGDWRILGQRAKLALGDALSRDLVYNFRSLRNIVEFNNYAISGILRSVNQHLRTKLQTSKISKSLKAELIGTLPRAYHNFRQTPRRESSSMGYISLEQFTDSPALVQRICEVLDRGYKPCDIMVLVRSARDGGRAAAALLDFKSKNSEQRYRFEVMTQDSLSLSNAPICLFLVALMHLISDPKESIQRAIFNNYLNRDFDAELSDEELSKLRSLRMLPLEEAFEQIVKLYKLSERVEEIAYLQALHEQLLSFTSNRVADIPLFLEWWEEHGKNRSLTAEQSLNTIEVTTIHKAKGLEKRVVLIPYCSWSLEPMATGEIPNVVWAEAEGEFSKAGTLPIRFSSKMAQSHFDESYFRELTYSYVDNVNLLYVALTRAKDELHIFISDKRPQIGAHILSAIEPCEKGVRIGKMEGRTSTNGDGLPRYEFGEALEALDEHTRRDDSDYVVEHKTIREYPSTELNPKLSLPTSKYLEKGGDKSLSARNFGILMHRIFEQAKEQKDVYAELEKILNDGLLNREEYELLKGQIETALRSEVTHSWFCGEWDRILQERDIILRKGDKSGAKKRPDRVMLKGKRAVIVDYKFGERESSSDISQIREYGSLLREMGYQDIEGWLWYVKLGHTERVV